MCILIYIGLVILVSFLTWGVLYLLGYAWAKFNGTI